VPEWKVPDHSTGSEELAKLRMEELAKLVTKIKNNPGLIKVVDNEDEFTEVYARDDMEGDAISRELLKSTHTKKKWGTYLAEAETALGSTGCRGFTGYNDMMSFLGEPAESDKVHECIHVLCSKKDPETGKCKFKAEFGILMLEGVTQYLTKKVCKVLKIGVKKAYPRQVTSTKNYLVKKHGLRLVYNAYFKGETEALVQSMIDNFKPKYSEKNRVEWTDYNHAKDSGTEDLVKLGQILYKNLIKPQLKEKFRSVC